MFLQQEMNGRMDQSIDNSRHCEDSSNYSNYLNKELMPLAVLNNRQNGDRVGFISK